MSLCSWWARCRHANCLRSSPQRSENEILLWTGISRTCTDNKINYYQASQTRSSQPRRTMNPPKPNKVVLIKLRLPATLFFRKHCLHADLANLLRYPAQNGSLLNILKTKSYQSRIKTQNHTFFFQKSTFGELDRATPGQGRQSEGREKQSKVSTPNPLLAMLCNYTQRRSNFERRRQCACTLHSTRHEKCPSERRNRAYRN